MNVVVRMRSDFHQAQTRRHGLLDLDQVVIVIWIVSLDKRRPEIAVRLSNTIFTASAWIPLHQC